MKTYAVHEIFLTLQGEGYWTGRRAVFCRFAWCNLWSGREEDRATAVCRFCDTDFVGGDRMTAAEIAERAAALWGEGMQHRFAVLTGGEPLLQLDDKLVRSLQRRGFDVAVETNGTRELPCRVDWVTCSPKAGTEIRLAYADELKLVYPQEGLSPELAGTLLRQGSANRFLQPMDGPDREANTRAAVDYCLAHPGWRLSLQAHKILGIP